MKLLITTMLSFFLFSSCNIKKKTEIEDVPLLESKQDVVLEITEDETPVDSVEVNLKTEDSLVTPAKETIVEIIEEKKPVKETKIKKEVKKEVASVKQTPLKTPEKLTEPKEIKEEVIEVEKVEEKVEEKIVAKPNHEVWNSLTKKYVSSNGKVNYAGFKKEIANIDAYLLHLKEVSPDNTWSRNEKLAYWFNLYNAYTVRLVAGNYPVQSIRDLEGGKPWDKKFIKSGAKTLSLNDIENTIVRPNYNEPRLHVAFNCAAISCPNLLNEAFIPNKLNSQLNRLSKKWINDTSKNVIAENEIKISKIFEWYGVDFKKGIINFINTYSEQKVSPDANISYLEYNWKLND